MLLRATAAATILTKRSLHYFGSSAAVLACPCDPMTLSWTRAAYMEGGSDKAGVGNEWAKRFRHKEWVSNTSTTQQPSSKRIKKRR